MGRKNNDFDSDEKNEVRRSIIQWLTKNNMGLLIGNDRKLVCRWAEFAGRNARTLNLLMEHNLINENQFIGVDIEKDIIEESKVMHPEATWVNSSWNKFVSGNPDGIGCMNIDTYFSVIDSEMKDCILKTIPLIEKGYEEFGQFFVAINGTMSRSIRFDKASIDRVKNDYCEIITEIFESSRILPKIDIDPISITVYKNEGSRHWMGNMCILFR